MHQPVVSSAHIPYSVTETWFLTRRQAAAREEEVCRQTAALKKTEYTLGAVKGELERGVQAREAARARIAGAAPMPRCRLNRSVSPHCSGWNAGACSAA